LPAIAQKFSQQYPRVVLHVMHSNLAELQFADLRNRDVELVLGRIQTPFVEDDLVAETLLDEPLLLTAGIKNKWSRRRQIELAELVDEPWILSPPDSLPGLLQAEVFRASGLPVPRPSMVTLSVQLFSIMLSTGRYVALLPGSIMRSGAHGPSLKILPAKLLSRPRPVGIVVVKDRTRSPVAERFIECARAVTKGLTKLPLNGITLQKGKVTNTLSG
jgi:DNA-binding transcriptional LysR family regulator